MDLDLLTTTLTNAGEPSYRIAQARRAALTAQADDWADISTLPRALREQLAETVPFHTVTVDHAEHSSDGSVKLRLLTHDGYPLEAVLMRFESGAHATRQRDRGGDAASQGTASGSAERTLRHTVCLSSQSGCALACTFCATGRMGLGRNLSRWEILDQFLILATIQARRGGKIDNVVMMGMGEPLHNYNEVIAALSILNDPTEVPRGADPNSMGAGLGARRIAISTAGWIPGIDKLAAQPRQFKLALSLHAPTDELRRELMPVTKRFPMNELMAACRRYRAATHRRVFVEYLMLAGVNDSPVQAKELANLLGPDGFHVNLIAYNPTEAAFQGSSAAHVERFAAILERNGVTASYRVSRGRDISAACGQLAAPLAKRPRRAQAAD